MFQAVAAAFPARKVLYAGSYVDVAPSFVFDDVTYADMDKRAAQFFADAEGVQKIISAHGGSGNAKFEFLHGDYRSLGLEAISFDMLISLYAGLISEACGQLLRIGGVLLANSSHGDAAFAALDSRFELIAVVNSAGGQYRISDGNLDSFMIPKKPQVITLESIRKSGRGIAYTKSPFAYVFRRIL